jgi:hypothetical protein
MHEPIKIIQLECWQAGAILYQAEGRTDDGKYVYVRYRRPWFSVGIGDSLDDAVGADTFTSRDHPDHDPGSITLATLREWAGGRFTWPARIEGYANEPG